MMRVAYVCADPGVPVFGGKGSSIHVQEVLRALIEHGATIDLFSYRVGGECPADLQGVSVHELAVDSSTDLFSRERNLLAANRALEQLLDECGPFDLVYERYALWAHAATAYARRREIRSVLEINAPLTEEQSAYRELLDPQMAEFVSSKAIRTATSIVAVSQKVAEYALRLGAPASRLHVVPNGVRPERYRARTFHEILRPGKFRIGYLGSLRPWHGVADLIEAFRLLDDAGELATPELCIVGDGPQRQALERQVSSFSKTIRERVRFVGDVAHKEVPAMLASFRVAVAPYTSEQHCYFSPLKLFEYMAAGLPIVAARAGQLAEIIRDEHNGLLYPPGDIDALAARIKRLRTDPILQQKLGRAARRDAELHHTWQQRVDQILDYVIWDRAHPNEAPEAVST